MCGGLRASGSYLVSSLLNSSSGLQLNGQDRRVRPNIGPFPSPPKEPKKACDYVSTEGTPNPPVASGEPPIAQLHRGNKSSGQRRGCLG